MEAKQVSWPESLVADGRSIETPMGLPVATAAKDVGAAEFVRRWNAYPALVAFAQDVMASVDAGAFRLPPSLGLKGSNVLALARGGVERAGGAS